MTANGTWMLLEPRSIDLVRPYGIPYPAHGLAHGPEQAVKIASRIGYPVVLKIVSPDIVHKSDAGGVVVGLEDPEGVREAYGRILGAVTDHVSDVEIEGVLVCRQAPPGLEIIVGALTDELFGPTVMVGMGGIYAEILEDVSFRVAPLTPDDAEEMLDELRGSPLLRGARGEVGYDVGAVVDLILKVSQLVMDRPDIEELDLNPVRVLREGFLALDVRVRLGQAKK